MGEALLEYSAALRSGFARVEVCEEAEAHGMGCSVHLGNSRAMGGSGRMDGGQMVRGRRGSLDDREGRMLSGDVSEFAHVKIPVSPSYLPSFSILIECAFRSLTATLVTSPLSSHPGSLRN